MMSVNEASDWSRGEVNKWSMCVCVGGRCVNSASVGNTVSTLWNNGGTS